MFQFLHILITNLCLLVFIILVILVGMFVLFRYGFNYSIFLMATVVEYFFMCLLAVLL